MSPTVHQRFFISETARRDGDVLIATLRDETSFALVLKHVENEGWCLTFSTWRLPPGLLDLARRIALLVHRERRGNAPRRASIKMADVDVVAQSICTNTRVLGVRKNENGPYIEAGVRLWARIGSEEVPKRYHAVWRAHAPLVSLTGRPVRTMDFGPAQQ